MTQPPVVPDPGEELPSPTRDSAPETPAAQSAPGAPTAPDVPRAPDHATSGTGAAPTTAGRRTAERNEPERRGLPRFLVVTLGLAALMIILWFTRQLQDIVAPIFFALNLVIVAYPLQRWLSRFVHRVIAAVVALVVILAVLVLFLWACVWALVELLNALPQYNKEFLELWKTISETAAQLGLDGNTVQNLLSGIQPTTVMSLVMPILSNTSAVVALLATLVTTVFFLSMDSASVDRRLRLLPRVQPRALAVVSDFSTGVRRYWLVTTVFGAIVAFADVGALAVIGVPLVWVWGVLSFVTNYIPNIGFVIGLVPPALLALLSGGWGPAVAVVAVYCVLNFVLQVLIQPKITGESVGVTATISFLSLLFWVFVLGPLGALLALPATLLVKAFLVDSDPRARWLNVFIASSPDAALPEPEPRTGSQPEAAAPSRG